MIYFLETSKFGIVEVDGSGKIVSFLEKPLPSATQSRLAVSTLLYRQALLMIKVELLRKDSLNKENKGHFQIPDAHCPIIVTNTTKGQLLYSRVYTSTRSRIQIRIWITIHMGEVI